MKKNASLLGTLGLGLVLVVSNTAGCQDDLLRPGEAGWEEHCVDVCDGRGGLVPACGDEAAGLPVCTEENERLTCDCGKRPPSNGTGGNGCIDSDTDNVCDNVDPCVDANHDGYCGGTGGNGGSTGGSGSQANTMGIWSTNLKDPNYPNGQASMQAASDFLDCWPNCYDVGSWLFRSNNGYLQESYSGAGMFLMELFGTCLDFTVEAGNKIYAYGSLPNGNYAFESDKIMPFLFESGDACDPVAAIAFVAENGVEIYPSGAQPKMFKPSGKRISATKPSQKAEILSQGKPVDPEELRQVSILIDFRKGIQRVDGHVPRGTAPLVVHTYASAGSNE